MRKTIQRLLSLALCLLLCAALLPGTVWAAEIVDSGTCGENLTWTLDSDGKLTISGTGKMKDYDDYSYSRSPWYGKRSSVKTVEIRSGVTSIGNYAFYDCSSLTSVTIPDGVTSIGRRAFYGCSSLTSVTIPNSVTSIGGGSFYNCSSLTSVHIDNLAAWCNISFDNEYSNPLNYANNLYLKGEVLTDCIIPDSVTSIGGYAFYNCISLTSVTIPNSVTSIGDEAFRNCDSLTSLMIPNSVTSIGGGAFSGCDSLTSVTIPNSVTSIGSSAFSWCSSLTSVTIGNSVTSIGGYAFYNCSSLTSVTIGNSVTSIGNYAFYDCDSLTSVTIPDSVTSIGDKAFYSCSSLTSVTIPDSVTSIGDEAFEYCRSLTSVTIPNSVTSIGYEVFFGCTSMTSVSIPNSVTSIGDRAFLNCSSLTSVCIPNSVTSIGDYAFRDCSSLTSVTIGNSVTGIREGAFYKCSSLTSVTIPESVTYIGTYAFRFCSSLTSVTIPSSVTRIGGDAFEYCISLTSVTIPNSVTSIGDHAFEGCSSLTSVTIPNSVTSIGKYAFYGCSSLTSVTIPNSVTSIGDGAFYKCSSLTSVTIPNSVTIIGVEAFRFCSSLTSVTIPNSVTSIGGGAFGGCWSLTSVTIPNSVTRIGGEAFSYCSSLTSVTIPNSVTIIGGDAFEYCSSLTDVYYTGSEAQWNAIKGGGKPSGSNVTIHFFSTGSANDRLLQVRVIAQDKATKADQSVSGACVSLFYDDQVRYYYTDENGTVTVSLEDLSDEQIAAATISAHKTWEVPVEQSGNRRYALQSRILNGAGQPIRYLYELHSEWVDGNGNWRGQEISDLIGQETVTLKLLEPRLSVNLSAFYYEPANVSSNKAAENLTAVKTFLSDFSQQLAASTDGHIMLNRVLIGKTDQRTDFYVPAKIENGERVPDYDAALLPSMADIRIEAYSDERTRIHSNASVGGFFSDSNADGVKDDELSKFHSLSSLEKSAIKGRFGFSRIQQSWKASESSYTLINDLYIATTHESGHYIIGLFDEYHNGNEKEWGWIFNARPSKAPGNFGLMDDTYDEKLGRELSNAESYSYLSSLSNDSGDAFKKNRTRQYYCNGRSCEEQLEALLCCDVIQWTNEYTVEKFIESYNASKKTNFHTLEEVLYDMRQQGFPELNMEELKQILFTDWAVKNCTLTLSVPGMTYLAQYSPRGDDLRRATYSYAALEDGDFVTTGGTLETLAQPMVREGTAELMGAEDGAETLELDTDGYLYEALDGTIYAYFIPEEACTLTLEEQTGPLSSGSYRSVNTATTITADRDVAVSGELYSVADVYADLDYASVSWFKSDGAGWTQLDTDLSEEKNMNIGARCDYAGPGTYVLMARPSSAETLNRLTNLRWSGAADQDGLITLRFDDANEGTAYYDIYYSLTPFTDGTEAGVSMVKYHAGQESYAVSLGGRNLEGYVAVAAVAENGARSPLSQVVTVQTGEADRDGDGIPDWYCEQYLLWPPSGAEKDIANSDDDGDGLTNLEEYQSGSNPRDPADPGVYLAWERTNGVHVSGIPAGRCAVVAGYDADGKLCMSVVVSGPEQDVTWTEDAKPAQVRVYFLDESWKPVKKPWVLDEVR